jgi:hypothetical protein
MAPARRGAEPGAESPQPPEEIAGAIAEFVQANPRAALLEDGRVLFDLRTAKYSLSTEHNHCTLQMWSEERNLVRRVVGVRLRGGVLRVVVQRMGQSKPQTLELASYADRRTPTARDAARKRYMRVLERVLLRRVPEWKQEAMRSAMDLERSFGPAYARGVITKGQAAWAVVGVNAEEPSGTVDGILTVGVLWLAHCREQMGGRRVFQGLRVVVPRGMGEVTRARMRWMNPAVAQWELWELDEKSEELEPLDVMDAGNRSAGLVHAPNAAAARERFARAAEQVRGILPEAKRGEVDEHVRGAGEMAFALRGLEFARARVGAAAGSFRQDVVVTFGAGAEETELTAESEAKLREFAQALWERRRAEGDKRDALYRMQPERWMESVLRRNVEVLDEELRGEPLYEQVPAMAGGERGVLDVLAVRRDGRLAVIELKADEDMHLALQGLDYWAAVRGLQAEDGLRRSGYFGGVELSDAPPKLYLVAPALRVHPAVEVVLRHMRPEVEWEMVAVGEKWRERMQVVWRKRRQEQ